MFRTSHRGVRQCSRFIRSNSRLMILLSLLLTGVAVGCILFRVYGKTESDFLGTLLAVESPSVGFRSLLFAVYNASFQIVILLLVLFFGGLSACGLPIVLLIPLFFGLGMGMSEAYYYSIGWTGVLTAVVVLLPPFVLKATALLMACAESMRMTLLLGHRLLSAQAETEGLYGQFRLYLLRFAVFALIALVGGIGEVLIRLLM